MPTATHVTVTPLPLEAPLDWKRHAAELEDVLEYLRDYATLAANCDGRARELHAVTTPAQRQVLYLEALRLEDSPASYTGITAAYVAFRTRELLPDGIVLHARGDLSAGDAVTVSVRQVVGASLAQLARRGRAYRTRQQGIEGWRLVP